MEWGRVSSQPLCQALVGVCGVGTLKGSLQAEQKVEPGESWGAWEAGLGEVAAVTLGMGVGVIGAPRYELLRPPPPLPGLGQPRGSRKTGGRGRKRLKGPFWRPTGQNWGQRGWIWDIDF